MANNKFSGKLAIDFSKIRDIYKVHLAENNFHGEADDMRFIDSLRNCTKLVELQIYSCNLTGTLPMSIGNLSDKLSSLGVGDNKLSGSLPSSIGSLVGLTALYLRSNRFKGKIPTTIGKLQKLQFLGLDNNQFSGPIPNAIGNLSLLNKLYLYSNKLEGHIPSSLGNCTNLNGLELADNRLSGNIPKQLLQLPSLTSFLGLSQNNLSGSIPSEISNLKMLSELNLAFNNLSGTITSSLGECISLTELYLSGNIIHGIIPSSLSSLRGLRVLDISQNNLSGKIPQFLDKWNSLEFLNLSFNDFEGEVPVAGVFADASSFSVLGNNRLCGGLITLELPKCKERGSKRKLFPLFVSVILIAPVLLVVLCCVYLLCKKKHNSQPSQSSGNERFLKVSYHELLKATDGFSTANLIGEGGFSSVYKGILDSNSDKVVAVKVLHLQNRGAHKSFLAECEAWRNIRHRNLLKIITSCSSVDFQGNDFKALVYEYMPNGSVHDWLHSSANTSKLNLLQRINILSDVAIALDYLHNRCQTTIVHGDLKPSNILLDADMVAHVGDFGLARLVGTDLNKNSSTGVRGTIGYAPPEYGLGSEMTSIGDIYSFGILLLEVMTGNKPTDGIFNEGLSLHKFAYKALPDHVIDVIDNDAIVLQSTKDNAKKVEDCLAATIKIGVSCSVDSPPQRMKIEIAVIELKHILDLCERSLTNTQNGPSIPAVPNLYGRKCCLVGTLLDIVKVAVYHDNLLEATVPEIQRSSLAGSVLYLKSLDLPDIDILKFDFLDAPSPESLQDALKQLFLIDAIDANGTITNIGKTMAELPLEPSLARTLIEANKNDCLPQALTVAAMLSVEGTLLPGRSKHTDKKRKQPPSDLPDGSGWGDHIQLLQIYELWDQSDYSTDWVKDNNLQVRGMLFVKNVRKQLCQIMPKFAK
ncbi:kinase-like domain-containing protein, partial [Tanacetum coccineum]